jgi:hypothetical protein
MMATPSAPQIYPELPQMVATEPTAHQQQFKSYLETEAKTREHLRKRYRRDITACDAFEGGMTVVSLGLGCAGVGLLSTIVLAPVVVGLEAASVACGAIGIASKFVARRLAAKEHKHDEIRILALAKANTIATHVSDALRDGNVSDEEFRIIMEEIAKYEDMKSSIRSAGRSTHAAVKIDEEAKNALIQRGHQL